MLPKQHRLSGRMVARVYAKGRFKRAGHLAFKALPNRQGITRLTVIVPKKVDNRATYRNKVRRQVIETIKPVILASTLPQDVVVTINKKQDSSVFVKEITECLKQLRLA